MNENVVNESNNPLLPILLVIAAIGLGCYFYFGTSFEMKSSGNKEEAKNDTENKQTDKEKEKEENPSKNDNKEKEEEINKDKEDDIIFDNSLITFKYSNKLNVVSELKECPGDLITLSDISYDSTKGEKPGYTIKLNCSNLGTSFTTVEEVYKNNKKYYDDNKITNYKLEVKEINGHKAIVGYLPDSSTNNEYKIITFYDTKNKKIYEFLTFWKTEAGYNELEKIVNTISIK